MSPKQQIDELRRQIREHDYLYYVQAQPVVSDYEYDQLMRQLQQLEAEHPELITPDSPTQRVGGVVEFGFPTHTFSVPMMSLDNAYSIEELREWHQRVVQLARSDAIEYVAELKIDGLSIALIYEEGLLAKGVTRGDGRIGEVVTSNIRTVRSIPLRLQRRESIEVRGEVFLRLPSFRQ